MTCAFVGLGSNLDQPRGHIETAIEDLAVLPATSCVAVSSLYRSAPMGPRNQPDFINAVVALQTRLSAMDLLDAMQNLEATHGREQGGRRWGPRPLDLDLLLFGAGEINTERLTVPHPGLARRAFVLYPLADIAPADLQVPGQGRLGALLADVDGGAIRILGDGV